MLPGPVYRTGTQGKHPTDVLHLLPPIGFSNPFLESSHPTRGHNEGHWLEHGGPVQWRTFPGMEADPAGISGLLIAPCCAVDGSS